MMSKKRKLQKNVLRQLSRQLRTVNVDFNYGSSGSLVPYLTETHLRNPSPLRKDAKD